MIAASIPEFTRQLDILQIMNVSKSTDLIFGLNKRPGGVFVCVCPEPCGESTGTILMKLS